jgi:predicted TIM-barrel fold metal-dependent hydrolase
MNHPAIIDALFCINRSTAVAKISDCAPFNQDLTPQMQSSGIAGAVLAPCNCSQCQHQWNCADRRTHEILGAVAQNRDRLRGLASYDPLRIGESLRWVDESVTEGGLVGAYAQAECCVSGLDAPRMYPLYGLCAKLRAPIIFDFTSRERWVHHRPQVEVVAADFPDLNILLATPPRTDTASIVRLTQRFPYISFLLCPQELQADPALCEYVELHGREHALFRSSSKGWDAAVEAALKIPLGPAARRAYLAENATRFFNFPLDATDDIRELA